MKIAALPVQGLCKRCFDIIEWKKRMGKYKPLTRPAICVSCSGRTVLQAYHVLCQKCASEKNVCAKCQGTDEVLPSTAKKTGAELVKEEQERERILGGMTERQRRSYLRRLERGDDEGAEKVLAAAAARGNDDGWSDFDDFEDDEDEDDDADEEEDD
ncbi:hypothetical protein HDV00_001190 [Rhizophlyctis rosea]|nr:hypothetical protein HDV00_001190 [Rhizophlyctis rosea]